MARLLAEAVAMVVGLEGVVAMAPEAEQPRPLHFRAQHCRCTDPD